MESRFLQAQSVAQLDELEKIALSPGSMAWAGRLGGAALGGIGGGIAGSQTADDPRSGAIRGALYGAGAGLLGGQMATKAGRGQAQRFGQRQLHGVTGYMPGRGLLGRGAEGTKWYQLGKKGPELGKAERLEKLKQMKWTMPEATTADAARKEIEQGMITGPISRALKKTNLGNKAVDLASRHKANVGKANQTIIDSGMTSIPGAVKAYAGGVKGLSPLQAAKANLLAPGLAMGAVLPAVSTGQSVQEYRTTGDASQLGRNLAETAGFGLIGGAPMIPSMVAGSLVGKGGEYAGRGVNKVVDSQRGRVVPRQ